MNNLISRKWRIIKFKIINLFKGEKREYTREEQIKAVYDFYIFRTIGLYLIKVFKDFIRFLRSIFGL